MQEENQQNHASTEFENEITAYEMFETPVEKALRIENSKNKAEEGSSRTRYRNALTDFISLLCKNRADIIIAILYLVIGADFIFLLWQCWNTFYLLDYRVIDSSIVYTLARCIIPFIVWVYSSGRDFYNFHRRKKITFYFVVYHAFFVLWAVLLKCLIYWLVPFALLIPVGGTISSSFVILSVYAVTASIIIVTGFFAARGLWTNMTNVLTSLAIIGFCINVYVPKFRKYKRFAYDMNFIRTLDSGKKFAIYEEDRRLHLVGIGSTGTGKTSAIFTVVFEGDTQQIAYNKDYQKRACFQLLEDGKVIMKEPFNDETFDIDKLAPVGSKPTVKRTKKYLEKLSRKAKPLGITALCPNAAFCSELHEIALSKGLRVNRVDPMLDINDPSWRGINPIYVPLEEDSEAYITKVLTAAKLAADVFQAVYELSSKGDPYFTGLNRNCTVTATACVVIAYPLLHPGQYATLLDVRTVISNFDEIRPYRDAMVKKYGKKNELGQVIMDAGKADIGPNLQFILSRIDRDFLGPNRDKIDPQATGLRNIIEESLMNPRIQRIFTAQNTVDFDKALSNNEITLINYEISLGSDSTNFGLFVLLFFIQAVLRRPGKLKTRTPHVLCIDEAPMLFHQKLEIMLTIFRQYNVSCMLFLQSLAQFEKNEQTRYIETVITGNTAHQIIFGRSSVKEMEMYQKIAGRKYEIRESSNIRETALSQENTSLATSVGSEVVSENALETNDIRNRRFLECTVLSVKNSAPVAPFLAKLNFLPEYKLKPIKRFKADWGKFYREEDHRVVVTAKTTIRDDEYSLPEPDVSDDERIETKEETPKVEGEKEVKGIKLSSGARKETPSAATEATNSSDEDSGGEEGIFM